MAVCTAALLLLLLPVSSARPPPELFALFSTHQSRALKQGNPETIEVHTGDQLRAEISKGDVAVILKKDVTVAATLSVSGQHTVSLRGACSAPEDLAQGNGTQGLIQDLLPYSRPRCTITSHTDIALSIAKCARVWVHNLHLKLVPLPAGTKIIEGAKTIEAPPTGVIAGLEIAGLEAGSGDAPQGCQSRVWLTGVVMTGAWNQSSSAFATHASGKAVEYADIYVQGCRFSSFGRHGWHSHPTVLELGEESTAIFKDTVFDNNSPSVVDGLMLVEEDASRLGMSGYRLCNQTGWTVVVADESMIKIVDGDKLPETEGKCRIRDVDKNQDLTFTSGEDVDIVPAPFDEFVDVLGDTSELVEQFQDCSAFRNGKPKCRVKPIPWAIIVPTLLAALVLVCTVFLLWRRERRRTPDWLRRHVHHSGGKSQSDKTVTPAEPGTSSRKHASVGSGAWEQWVSEPILPTKPARSGSGTDMAEEEEEAQNRFLNLDVAAKYLPDFFDVVSAAWGYCHFDAMVPAVAQGFSTVVGFLGIVDITNITTKLKETANDFSGTWQTYHGELPDQIKRFDEFADFVKMLLDQLAEEDESQLNPAAKKILGRIVREVNAMNQSLDSFAEMDPALRFMACDGKVADIKCARIRVTEYWTLFMAAKSVGTPLHSTQATAGPATLPADPDVATHAVKLKNEAAKIRSADESEVGQAVDGALHTLDASRPVVMSPESEEELLRVSQKLRQVLGDPREDLQKLEELNDRMLGDLHTMHHELLEQGKEIKKDTEQIARDMARLTTLLVEQPSLRANFFDGAPVATDQCVPENDKAMVNKVSLARKSLGQLKFPDNIMACPALQLPFEEEGERAPRAMPECQCLVATCIVRVSMELGECVACKTRCRQRPLEEVPVSRTAVRALRRMADPVNRFMDSQLPRITASELTVRECRGKLLNFEVFNGSWNGCPVLLQHIQFSPGGSQRVQALRFLNNLCVQLSACRASMRVCQIVGLCWEETRREAFVLRENWGPNLRQHVSTNHPHGLPLETVVHVALQLTDGLEKLQRQHFFWDMYPTNVLINPDRMEVRLTDIAFSPLGNLASYGSTRYMDLNAPSAMYVAPEVEEHGRATAKTIVCSLGKTMQFMASGQDPDLHIPGLTPRPTPLSRPSKQNVDSTAVSTAFHQLCREMTLVDPDERLSLSDAAAALHHIQTDLDGMGCSVVKRTAFRRPGARTIRADSRRDPGAFPGMQAGPASQAAEADLNKTLVPAALSSNVRDGMPPGLQPNPASQEAEGDLSKALIPSALSRDVRHAAVSPGLQPDPASQAPAGNLRNTLIPAALSRDVSDGSAIGSHPIRLLSARFSSVPPSAHQ